MGICVICGEQYEEGYDQCPVCACPVRKYTIAGLGFPENLQKQYELVGLRRGSGSRTYLCLRSRQTGKRILAGKLRPEESRLYYIINTQKEKQLPMLPRVYETFSGSDGMYFLFEEVPGTTLQEMMEREYPPDDNLIQYAMDFVTAQIKTLSTYGCCPEEMDPNTLVISEDGIRMFDFGGTDEQKVNGDMTAGLTHLAGFPQPEVNSDRMKEMLPGQRLTQSSPRMGNRAVQMAAQSSQRVENRAGSEMDAYSRQRCEGGYGAMSVTEPAMPAGTSGGRDERGWDESEPSLLQANRRSLILLGILAVILIILLIVYFCIR